MRAVIQRVTSASVTIGGMVKSSIGPGLLILLGIGHEDEQEDIDWLVRKVAGLRIFNDEDGVMNRSVMDTGGDVIVVSQFTLMAPPEKATGRPTSARRGTNLPFRCTSASARSCPPPSASRWAPGNLGPICRWRLSMTVR